VIEDASWARARFAGARVARLATAARSGEPHLVPIVFALDGETVYFVVDAKPKQGVELARVRNIRTQPHVSLLVDHYDDDWTQLWWARADGTARVLPLSSAESRSGLGRLFDRYAQYQHLASPPGPMIAIDVTRWTGWSARN